MVDAVAAATGQSQAKQAGTTLAADLDAFLLLLTTQLQHQDPLSPLEPTEFTGQLVQFASVEQQIATNDNMEKLLDVQNAALASAVVGFIGTSVEADIGQIPLQDGEAKYTYTLDSNVQNTVMTITDDKGRVVFTQAGERTAGTHEVAWDGKDTNGIQQPDGAYFLSVTPVAFEGSIANATTSIFAKVTGVTMSNGDTTMDASGVSIPLEKITTVKQAESGS